jgi:hypothetical protein
MKTTIETHTHHIIPRYRGGTDSLENLVQLTVTQHSMWHYAEWKLWGNWQDKLAWQGLASLIPHDEITSTRLKEGRIKGGKVSTPRKAEAARQNAKKAHKKVQEIKCGVYSLTREESSLATKGKIWINNGIKTKRILPTETIPENWVKGRLTPWLEKNHD